MSKQEMQTLVVGAGVLGSAIADELANRGEGVYLIDRHHPGHDQSASGDTTRILRSGYGPNSIYTQRAWRAHKDWRALEERVDEQLVIPAGAIWFASGDGSYEQATFNELTDQGIPVERLEPEDLAAMYPSINVEDVAFGVHETKAGVLRARRAVEVLAESAVARGAQLLRGTATPTVNGGVEIDGDEVKVNNVIWASGAWTAGLFPDIVRTKNTTQDAVFVNASGTEWSVESVPAWIDPHNKRYGIGAENQLLKVASSELGLEFDPWDKRPEVSEATIRSAVKYATHRFPQLATDTAAHVHPCQYASTADTQFILARHPQQHNWWLAAGDSGHAFKHAHWVSRHIADLLEGKPEDANFGLGPRDGSRGLRVSSND